MKKDILNTLKILLAAVVISFSVSAVYAAWTAPTATPPGNNAFAPINTSTTSQAKPGDLGVNSFFADNAQFGNTGGGTLSQSASVDIITNRGTNAFQVWDDNNLSVPKFIVKRNGNVGVGTTNPTAKLDVAGSGIKTTYMTAGNSITSPYVNASETLTAKNVNVSGGVRFPNGTVQTTAPPAGSMIYANLGEDFYSPFVTSNTYGDTCNNNPIQNYICPVNVSKTCTDLSNSNGPEMRTVRCRAAQFFGVVR